jgi:succinate-semialdehyde dehydrogenase / glutarate-semialdehyde dehydrogenase
MRCYGCHRSAGPCPGSAAGLEQSSQLGTRKIPARHHRPYLQSAGEVNIVIEQFEWFAGEAEWLFGETIPSRQGERLVVEHEPASIVAAFTAWNFPINLMARKIAPALAAGCPIICRPSEQMPMTSTMIVECCVESGIPGGAGQRLLAEAAKTVKRASMTLGGHAPVVICEDADIEKAADLCAQFKFPNAGQVCIAPSRFYIQESIADKFTAGMAEKAKALIMGDSQTATTSMGPLTLVSQRNRIEAVSADLEKRGARLLAGGRRPAHLNKGFYFEPTVFCNVSDDAAIMQNVKLTHFTWT